VIQMKQPDAKELRLLEREPELDLELAAPPEPMDAAEVCWDPWLVALARIESLGEALLRN
jgi:hypothetical protein